MRANFRGARCFTFEAGENKSGHISSGPNQGILFFDNIFPLRLQWLLSLPLNTSKTIPEIMNKFNSPNIAAADPLSIIKRAVPPEIPITVVEVLPRIKEGGAYVKFSKPEDVDLTEAVEKLRIHLREHPIKPWFNPFRRVRASLVQGRPWIEDLNRTPTKRLKVEFLPATTGGEAAELSPEALYSLFRPFGKLADIVPQPPDSKVLPKFAYLNFVLARQATMAKNCMHGFKILEANGGGKSGTQLRLLYEQTVHAHWIRDWIFSHPRVVIPAIAALVAAITVAVFDPIRTFFVKAHISHTWDLTNNSVIRWFKDQATDILVFRKNKTSDVGLDAIWDDRRDAIEQIRRWLMETTDTFIVIQGPRGSGKRELLLDQALKHRKNTLVIDCKPIQEARGDSSTIDAAAREVGYRPVFSFMNSISGLIDLAAQGTIGTKTGFSETLDTQLAKILANTATALKQIALEDRKKNEKDANMGMDEYLEAHPERRPVVVIDNFLHKSQENDVVYDKLAEWAASLTTSNIAHVVFLTNDVSFSKSLSKALPDRVFRQISLGDCKPEVAKRYVINQLDSDADLEEGEEKLTPSQRRSDLVELDGSIEVLGGRLTDLEFLARRIKAGETPSNAVHEIVEQSASEVLKMYIFGTESGQRKWTQEQAWLLIKQLAEKDSLRYNEVLLSDTYKSGGEDALRALEQAELITIISANGRPYSIKPGKPVYQAAFKTLIGDRVLNSRLDLGILTELIKIETASIDKYEGELNRLGALPKQPSQLSSRISWLLDKIAGCQDRIMKYETDSVVLKKVLKTEF
ncbi:hypothetical protein L228DRAFT_249385 [Xylona heveae TC161]|uniref:Mitochondrial escape protein 2 n=1 Tax=Xylona heveae (strain CBS 132557 / TC161) TaxID=1328760 RepID=A0A165AK39_XYLHT|nr:hypothetical protein L228DRAFT_249385 [Xylona heveae TC161]KZF20614.1 hypothetical protein L228DRAFT_249385 [Xylona heveae TC161]